jgi:hypothetical protein
MFKKTLKIDPKVALVLADLGILERWIKNTTLLRPEEWKLGLKAGFKWRYSPEGFEFWQRRLGHRLFSTFSFGNQSPQTLLETTAKIKTRLYGNTTH